MNIDWSKAPEGATHWDTGMNNRVAGWMRLDGGIWYWWPAEDAFSCLKKWHASLNQHMVKSEGFVARPTSWAGEGLPPVGTVCQFAGGFSCEEDPFDKDLREGDKVTIIAHFKDGPAELAAFTFNAGKRNPGRGTACVEQGSSGCFRPIRTPEQIAAEEREHSIRNACTAISAALNGLHESEEPTAVAIIEAMIDAGFQRVTS